MSFVSSLSSLSFLSFLDFGLDVAIQVVFVLITCASSLRFVNLFSCVGLSALWDLGCQVPSPRGLGYVAIGLSARVQVVSVLTFARRARASISPHFALWWV